MYLATKLGVIDLKIDCFMKHAPLHCMSVMIKAPCVLKGEGGMQIHFWCVCACVCVYVYVCVCVCRQSKQEKGFFYLNTCEAQCSFDVLSEPEWDFLRHAKTPPLLKAHVVVHMHHLRGRSVRTWRQDRQWCITPFPAPPPPPLPQPKTTTVTCPVANSTSRLSR